jgi:hypothetical protein
MHALATQLSVKTLAGREESYLLMKPYVVDFDTPMNSAGAVLSRRLQPTDAGELARSIDRALDRASEKAAHNAATRFARVWKRVAKALAREWRETLPMLAAHGWYLDGGMSPENARMLARMMSNGQNQDADHLLLAYFDEHSKRIEAELIASFPSRRVLIRGAFSALRQRRYSLAIPVLLAQADGICADELGASLFIWRERQTIGNRIATADQEWQAVTAPLLSLGTLATSTRDREVAGDEFNRHAILHGLVVNYGTRRNAFKAISLLSYVNVVITRWKETTTRTRPAG